MSRNPLKRYRIDYWLFSIFAGFIILLLVVVIRFSYHYSSKELAGNTSYYQQALLVEINKQLKIQQASIEQISLAFSRNVTLNQFLASEDKGYERYIRQLEIEALLAQITYSSSNIESVDLYLENPLVSRQDFAVRLMDDRLLQAEEWYPDLKKKGSIWIGEHEIATQQGQVAVVSFARVIYSNIGEATGVLAINMKAQELQKIMKGEQESKVFQRYLMDAGGNPIVASGEERTQQEQVREYMRSFSEPTGHVQVSNMKNPVSLGGNYLMVWSHLPQSDWVLIEITPWENITEGSFKMALKLIFIGGIAILIALAFSLYISRQFTKPIGLLLVEMGKFRGNSTNVQANLPADYSNEFGALFQGYRRLVSRMNELYQLLKEQYKRQKESELKALQAMINPHFLYNTLDQINWMALENDQKEISRILEMVGRMFRIVLSNGNSLIPIKDELTLISCYIQIQQVRWGKGLHFNLNVPEDLQDCSMLKMALQPFVENAIVHGLHGRMDGLIEIFAAHKDDSILFTVQDNGTGIPPDWNSRYKVTGGYGIRNVMERIDSYFGPPYGVQLINNDGKGTIVQIVLPIIRPGERKQD